MNFRKHAQLSGRAVGAAAILLAAGLAGCGKSEQEKKTEAAATAATAEAARIRETGSLLVKSNRVGATVEAVRAVAGGEAATAGIKGTIDQALSGLTPGKYAVTVHSDGWPDVRGEADVAAGRPTELTLNFKSGSLRLDSDPAGATVKQGETILGKTPLVIPQLPVGECRFVLSYLAWPPVSLKATIAENTEAVEAVRLPHGKLTVESTPPGAMVLLAGKPAGQTPLTLDPLPAGPQKLTLQAKEFPAMEASVTVEDRGEAKVSRELGYGFPELDPQALLRSVWVPDDPNKLSLPVDSLGVYESRNGIVKNLHRKRLYETWLRKSYRYSATVKSYDREKGKLEFVEQAGALSKYRVVAELPSAVLDEKDLAALTAKGAKFTVYGRLGAVEEPRWPSKVITLELWSAEPLH